MPVAREPVTTAPMEPVRMGCARVPTLSALFDETGTEPVLGTAWSL
jgi:hypothetical protein